jgi:hypothetical protein
MKQGKDPGSPPGGVAVRAGKNSHFFDPGIFAAGSSSNGFNIESDTKINIIF